MPTKFGSIVAARACVRTGGILEAADAAALVAVVLLEAPDLAPVVVDAAGPAGAARAMFIL